MPEFSRRNFLKRSSVAVATAGAAASLPGLPSLLSSSQSDAQSVEADISDILPATSDQPLVAHIKDLQSGEMSLFQGEREMTFRDPQLAARLYRAMK
jgi:hypothetical protein